MKLFCKNTFFLILVFSFISIGATQETIVPPCVFCTVTCEEGFLVVDAADPLRAKTVNVANLDLSARNDTVFINGQSTRASKVYIAPVLGDIQCVGKNYSTPLVASSRGNAVTISPYAIVQQDEAETELLTEDESKKEGTQEEVEVKKRKYTVRVLLDNQEIATTWKLRATKSFTVFDNQTDKQKDHYPVQELAITIHNDRIQLNDASYEADLLYIVSDEGHIAFNDNEYQGSFLVAREGNKACLVNALDLEDYVFSVLRTESWPGWPLEVNKVCAVASRTYAIAVVLGAGNKPYHIRNTNIHQTYSGFHNDSVIKDAVEQTKGIFLAHDKRPIMAMFDACCGGVITKDMRGVDFQKAPYLARSYACTYCKPCKIYGWECSYSLPTLYEKLKKDYPQLKRLRDIKITKKDDAGVVHQLSLKGIKNSAVISGKKLYSLFKNDLKSFCFSIHRHDNIVHFKGRGYGHHLGLCQWGAREMVRNGFDYKRILRFYYPNTVFMCLR